MASETPTWKQDSLELNTSETIWKKDITHEDIRRQGYQ
jgi:hypothetical protein